ncbi:RNA polymerase subunit sigma-70, partial [Streptomyces nigra]
MADGIDGIPEQARPHPEDDSVATGLLADGRDDDGAVQGTPPAGRIGVWLSAEAAAAGRDSQALMGHHDQLL